LSAGFYDQYYGRGQQVRRLIAADFEQVCATGVDVLFTPTVPGVAFRLGERINDPVQMYLSDVFTVTANLIGAPAISLPIGDHDGLPVGGQFIGRHFQETVVLQAAWALESTISDRPLTGGV
jgi:aspartyl-tRNA(Asn)/glutamyl-tRNA(Gln) amidotransferase subunit A